MEILDNIPFKIDRDELLSKVHIEKESEDRKDIENLVKTASALVKPKAIYEVSYIQSKNHDSVNLGGITFASRILRVNLDKAERVFPYIATCGKELDEIEIPSRDFMRRFWVDTIKSMALTAGSEYLNEYLKKKYALGEISRMSPGASRPDLWPIEQQKELFSIFGNREELIGVKLTDSFLMIPNKSVSGIYFPREISFESCRLCPRDVCPGRRSPYDKDLLGSYYEREPEKSDSGGT